MCMIERIRSRVVKFYRTPCRKIGYMHFRQSVAFRECRTFNARHAVSDRYACQSATIKERTPSYARYAVWYRYTRQIVAISERIISDACHAVGDNKLSYELAVQIQVMCIIKRVSSNSVKFDCTPCRNVAYMYFRQSAATRECRTFNARYAVSNRYAC